MFYLLAVAAVAVVIFLAVRSFLTPSQVSRKIFADPPPMDIPKTPLSDEILKTGYKKNLPTEPVDVIVIGSGVGGLATAAMLSKAGKKVLVLEQHDRAGGCMHTFEEHGWEWDTGVHYVGRIGKKDEVSRVLLDSVTDNCVDWAPLADSFDVVQLGERQYRLASGKQRYLQALLDQFPNDHAAIHGYFEHMKRSQNSAGAVVFLPKIVDILPWPIRALLRLKEAVFPFSREYCDRSTLDVVQSLTDNKELIAVLTYNWGDIGLSPSQCPFWIQSGVTDHYLYGAYYPVGGPGEIAKHLTAVIERHGGKVLVRAPVEEILVENNMVMGVRIEKGPSVFAPIVVSACGTMNTFGKLLPESNPVRQQFAPLLKQLEPSVQHACLFLGLKGTREELGLDSFNLWVYPNNEVEDEQKKYEQDPLNYEGMCFISFPSAKDPTYESRHPGKSTAVVVQQADFHSWKKWESNRVKKRGVDYEEQKKKLTESMRRQVERFFPQVADKIEYVDASTPVTSKYYLGAQFGESYGLAMSKERFDQPWLKAQTPIRGLFLAGQDVTSAGFAPSLMSSLLTTSAVLEENIVLALLEKKRTVTAQIKKTKKSC